MIEERRQCAEDLLQFSANIPALYNSRQLQDFFKVCSFPESPSCSMRFLLVYKIQVTLLLLRFVIYEAVEVTAQRSFSVPELLFLV